MTSNGESMLPGVFPVEAPGAVLGAPLLQTSLQQALTSAESVIYQWDVQSGRFTFSDNIDSVFPFDGAAPVALENWETYIHESDRPSWISQRARWLKEGKSSNLIYRFQEGDRTVWLRQSGVAVENGAQIIGVIHFHCRPPATLASDVRGMRVNSVSMSARPAGEPVTNYSEELVKRLTKIMNQTEALGRTGALLIMSVANHEMILNAFGHQASETVMLDIGSEIQAQLNSYDALIRIHRDQFAIILSDCRPEELQYRAAQISDCVLAYGHKSSVGSLHAICAFGSQSFPSGRLNANETIDRAFADLYQRNSHLHPLADPAGERVLARQQMGLANYLRSAIRENKLRLAFQPIISAEDGRISHYEALLRLISEDGTLSSAGALIPVAERMGLIDMIDHMVLDMVFKELEASPQVTLAFNVSNLTTDNPLWLQHFSDLMKRRPDIANRMIIEITETAAHRDLRRTAYFVASLQEHGCQVALDDFGSGYTSFRQLKSLSVDMIKIDGAFVRDLADNADNRFFVKTLLEFTQGFGLKSVAEYVESGNTAKMLMELGIDYMQGYYFGKPENFRSWLNGGEYRKS